MNKKMIMMVLAALLVLAVGTAVVLAVTADRNEAAQIVEQSVEQFMEQSAEAEPAEESGEAEIFELSGAVIELGEGYFVLQDAVHGAVQVNTGDDTLFEGVAAEELAVGQIVLVLYDGKMTRSLPAQVYGLKVGVYAVRGEVAAVEEGAITLVREEIGDEVIVFLPEGAPQIAVGDSVTAYTNGAMTMSLPAQTTALGVVIE